MVPLADAGDDDPPIARAVDDAPSLALQDGDAAAQTSFREAEGEAFREAVKTPVR